MSILKPLDKICSVVGCGAEKYCKGMCKTHYARVRRNGTVEKLPHYDCRGPNNPKWKGGQTHDGQGRIYVYRPGHKYANNWGYVYRYRVQMEAKIGRPLLPHEIVHHKDGDYANDHLDNLELVTSSEHSKIHNNQRTRNKKGQFTA